MILLGSPAYDFVDGSGQTVNGLQKARLTKYFTGPFLLYVLPTQILGGSIGVAGIVPNGAICGRLFPNEPNECTVGVGDPYVEMSWSRSFGTVRPSEYVGALPIQQGLTVSTGIGVVLPLGRFDAQSPTDRARSTGTNIYDIAPSVAVTYTTPPLLFEGTEFSAKFYLNKYLENPETSYLTGSIASLDFALSERMGRFQIGVAGNYLIQFEDDELLGVAVPPDGRRAESLTLGPVLNVDVPEYGAALKLKMQSSVYARNSVKFWGMSFGWVRKF
ncbi:MAG: transporter [Hyphomicrobiaceae bacterium]